MSKARDLIESRRRGAKSGASSESLEADNANESRIAVYDTDGNELDISESVIDMMEAEDDKAQLSADSLVAANAALFDDLDNKYAYGMLSEEEKTAYKEIYSILCMLKSDVLLSSKDTNVIDHSFKAVLVDNPEIFYVTGYSINKYMLKDELRKITFSGTYTMDSTEAAQKSLLVDAYVGEVLSKINTEASDYEKIKYVYEYLINNNSYDMEAPNNQNILSVCENGLTVCQGYSKMAQLLLNKMGIFATLVNGYAANSSFAEEDGTIHDMEDSKWGAHVWNIVRIDGEYYNMDVTWGDSSFVLNSSSGDYVKGPEINYDYLLVPDSELLGTHEAAPVVAMPSCVSMKDNYYVREGLYFTDIDKQKLHDAFDRGYREGTECINIKCADEEVYEQMRDYLFAGEAVFEYITSSSVRYVEYPNRLALSVML